MQQQYKELATGVKEITVNLKFGSHNGKIVKIEGILIKCKACHFQIVSHIFNKIPEVILETNYQSNAK